MEDDQHGLYIPALRPENVGRYTCAAENDKGKATCSANLVVSEPAQLIIPLDEDFTVDGTSQKSFKMTSVTKSTSVMQKSFTSSSSTSEGLNSGNVEYHKLSTQEEHALQKAGDKPMQEMHSSRKEEIHKKKVVSKSSNQTTTLQALTSGYDG